MPAPCIKTTVVGSYPFPDWLGALPSEQAVIDATRVVIHIQEQAGIDLVCDGELYRFDVNHPETNGMIEYFVKPMAGVRSGVKFEELVVYRDQPATKFRTRPPAVVEGPIGPGTLDLPQACARAKRLTSRPFKFTLTGPHMLAKMLYDVHYRSLPELTMAIADALAVQVKHLDADVVQVDEANLPGRPGRVEVGSRGGESRTGRRQDNACGSPLLRKLWRSVDPERNLGAAHGLSECIACRPHRHGDSAPSAG